MILCKWNNRWFLASKAQASTPSCSISCPDWEDLVPMGFRREVRGGWIVGEVKYPSWVVYTRHMPTMDGITFYPEIRWQGMKVRPERWDHESEEPMLLCILYIWDTNHIVDAETGVDMETIHEVEKSGDRERWERLIQERDRVCMDLRHRLFDAGWTIYEDQSMLQRLIHVDELEKIEGPPPEGAF